MRSAAPIDIIAGNGDGVYVPDHFTTLASMNQNFPSSVGNPSPQISQA